MFGRQIARHRGTALRALLGVVAVSVGLAAAAIAATRQQPAHPSADELKSPAAMVELRSPEPGNRAGARRPPRPRLTEHPDALATSTRARFAFALASPGLRSQCRIDGGRWKTCRSPVAIAGLRAGRHRFLVRARDRRGRRGAATRFRWTVLEPKPFSIEPQLSGLASLYPRAPAVALPVTIANPNPVAIFVTGLRARATADPPGCSSAENLEFTPAGLSSAAPLRIPANATVDLPSPGIAAPAIRMLDLPVNQDACQNAEFPLVFGGEARG